MESEGEIDITCSFPNQKAFLKSVITENFEQYCDGIAINDINTAAAESTNLMINEKDGFETITMLPTKTGPSNPNGDKNTFSP